MFKKLERIPGMDQYRCVGKIGSTACFETAYRYRTCGFVPGDPAERNYDELGPMSGSAGIDYSCRICGGHLGREKSVVS